jgi:hypothetical protein
MAGEQGGQDRPHGAILVQQGCAATDDCQPGGPGGWLRSLPQEHNVPGPERAAGIPNDCARHHCGCLCVPHLLYSGSSAAERPGPRHALARLATYSDDRPQPLPLPACPRCAFSCCTCPLRSFDSSRPISPGRRLFHADKILVHLNVCHQSSGMIGWAGLRECVVCRCGVDFWFAPPRLVAAARPAIHLYHVDDECDAHWQPNSGMHSPRAMFDTAKLLMWAHDITPLPLGTSSSVQVRFINHFDPTQ